jgi:hypothetical protein
VEKRTAGGERKETIQIVRIKKYGGDVNKCVKLENR